MLYFHITFTQPFVEEHFTIHYYQQKLQLQEEHYLIIVLGKAK